MHARLVLAITLIAHVAAADDGVEDVHVRGSQAQGFDSRAKLDDAPREITDAASLVEPLLGVHVRRLGGDDGFATISIRGSSSNQVAFYFAGVPLPGAGDSTVDLSTLPLWPGSQARVHRTFTPAALGQGSLGGTLAIDPPKPTDPVRTEIWSAGGSFGSLRMRIGDVSDLGRGVRVASGLSASRTQGDFSFYNVEHDQIGDPRTYVPRENDDSAQASGLVSLFAPAGKGSVRATAMLQAREQGLPGSIYLPTPFQRIRTDRELATVEIAEPVSRGVVGAQIWGVREGTDFRDLASSTNPFPSLQVSTITSAGGNGSFRGRFEKLQIATKLDVRGERYEPGEYVGPSLPRGATRTTIGLGADAELAASRAVSFAASARVDGWHDASDDPAITGSFDARPNAHVGVDVALGSVHLAAHGGYTSRPANFIERFGTSGGFIPSPNLLPESAWTIDAGARAKKRFGKLLLDAEIAGFAQAAEDLIVFVPVGYKQTPQAQNVGSAVIAGVEAEAIARYYGAEIRASYTGLHTENESRCGATCPPLPGRPAHDFVIDVAYQLGPLRVRYGIDGLIGTTYDVAGTIEEPPRVLQSAGLRLDVMRGVRVALDVRNLFDVRVAYLPQQFLGTSAATPIADVYAFPLPGRSFLLSVAWRPNAR